MRFHKRKGDFGGRSAFQIIWWGRYNNETLNKIVDRS